MSKDKIFKDGCVGTQLSCRSANLSQIKFKCCLQLLATYALLVLASKGLAGEIVSDGNSVHTAVAASATRPCVTDRQVDTALGDAMTGPARMPGPDSIKIPKEMRGPTDVLKEIGKNLGNLEKAAVTKGKSEGADTFTGIRAKVENQNSEARAHIERLYQEYRRLAAQGKVTAGLRDTYAKEKIGPRLDTINVNETNWLGGDADRSRMAGQVYAYVELVEIERQETERLEYHADTEKTCQQNWAIRVKHKTISKDKDYQVGTWDEERKICLANFKKQFYQSPQYLKAELLKKTIAEQKPRAEAAALASKECEDAEAPTALPRRGGSSGAEMFQQAINQAEQEERERPIREARERARLAAEAERARAAPTTSNVSSANSKYAWDCNLMNGKWKMTSRAYPGASLIFSAKVSNGRYTHTRLEVKGIDGSNSVMTGSCSDYTRENQLSKDAMTIKVGDGTWVHTRLTPLPAEQGNAEESAQSRARQKSLDERPRQDEHAVDCSRPFSAIADSNGKCVGSRVCCKLKGIGVN